VRILQRFRNRKMFFERNLALHCRSLDHRRP
jgi:hypothetical protein